jgi:glycosyltransferase 2 family protein
VTSASATRRASYRLLQILLLAAVAWGIYRVLAPELSQLSRADLTQWRPAPLPLAASLLLLVAVYLMHALLWRRILTDLSIATPLVRTSIRVYFLASLGRYLPGKVWQLAGLAVLAGKAGIPAGPAAAAAVLGQFGFLTTGLLFLGITLPEWPAAIGAADNGGVSATLPLAVGAVLLITGGGLIWLLVATPLGHGFRNAVTRGLHNRAGSRAADRVAAAFALADRVRPRDAALWAAAYAISWVVLGAAFVLFASAFHPPLAELPRFVAGTVAAAYLVGYLFILVPAGIGVREGAMLLLLQQVMPAGGALVISVLSRVWFTAAELVPLAFLPVLGGTGTFRREDGES